METIIDNFELLPSSTSTTPPAGVWKAPQAGGNISDGIPTTMKYNLLVEGREFVYAGKDYAGWLGAIELPLIDGYQKLTEDIEIMIDPAAERDLNALEHDTRISDKLGWNYNMSKQWNQTRGGMLQISNAAGGWVDTGYAPGPFMPYCWQRMRTEMFFDFKLMKYSIISVQLNSRPPFFIPAALQNLTATKMNWAPGCNFQYQLGGGKQPSAFSAFLTRSRYAWHD